MVNGPGLYSEIGKKARGANPISFFSSCFCYIQSRMYIYWRVFPFLLMGFNRSLVQGLPDWPQVHSKHLLSYWCCKLFPFFFFLFFFYLYSSLVHFTQFFCLILLPLILFFIFKFFHNPFVYNAHVVLMSQLLG